MVNPVMMPMTTNTAGGGAIISMETENEDSMDAPPSVGSSVETAPVVVPPTPTPATPPSTPSTGKKGSKRMKTGYQVFSSELWNKVKAERGYDSFTEIIREIAQMWRTMSDSEKSVWEEKCKKMNKEAAARMAAENNAEKNDRP